MTSRLLRHLPTLFVFAMLGIAASGCGGPCKDACPRIANCVDRPNLSIGACIEACRSALDEIRALREVRGDATEVWSDLCHALLGTKEFIYLN